MTPSRVSLPIRVAGDDRRNLEPWVGGQQRPMEHPAGQAEPDQPDTQWSLGRHS